MNCSFDKCFHLNGYIPKIVQDEGKSEEMLHESNV